MSEHNGTPDDIQARVDHDMEIVVAAGLGDEEARKQIIENMAGAYIAAMLYRDSDRDGSLITGFRGMTSPSPGVWDANEFQVEVVGEWLTVRVEMKP